MHYLEKFYHSTATHSYLFGTAQNGRVIVYRVRLPLDGYYLIFNEKPTTASRQTVVKFRSTRAKVAYLESIATERIDLCTEEELKGKCRTRLNRYGKPYIENCGDCLEWLMAERYGVKQNEKTNLSHKEGGDIEIDGEPYQVKYEKGAITIGG